MCVALMTGKGQQWLRLGERECTILDAMLEWAKATAKNSPERVQAHDDGGKSISSGGYFPKHFSVSRFDGGVPGIGWGSYDYWAVKVGQDSDWHLLFDDDRGTTVLEEVRWATNKLHGINVAHGLAPSATMGYPYQDIEDWWREHGLLENEDPPPAA